VYDDKISGKIIITTYDSIQKINKSDENYTIKKDDNTYFNLKKIVSHLEKNIVVSNGTIYVSNNEYIEATVKNNRTEIYDKLSGDVISFVNKENIVKVVVDNNINEKNVKVVNVVITKGNISYYGYVLKENLQYEYIKNDIIESKDKVVLVKADDKLISSTDTKYIDMVAINMYRLSGVNTLTKLEYTNNVPDNIEVFATINNGQTSSNYDSDITTRMLNSESNREVVIQKLLVNIKNIGGINIDFAGLKTSDKDNFTQFIKELAAVLHANDKKIIVNISNSQYISIYEVAKVVDYIIIQPYNARTTASKTSGPISSIPYVENKLKDVLAQQIVPCKVILEIPTYSVLWTERKGTVINAEIYNMQMIEEYIIANNIHTTLDNVSGQNYINYTKGITTYKMWLEDQHSVNEKIKFVNKYNLAGVSIYRSGMEIKEIYANIYNNLNK